jgi:hypothetical protein
MHRIYMFIAAVSVGECSDNLRQSIVAACVIAATPMYEKRIPVEHVLYIELPWRCVLNTFVFCLHRGVLKVGAGTKAKCQAQGKR